MAMCINYAWARINRHTKIVTNGREVEYSLILRTSLCFCSRRFLISFQNLKLLRCSNFKEKRVVLTCFNFEKGKKKLVLIEVVEHQNR